MTVLNVLLKLSDVGKFEDFGAEQFDYSLMLFDFYKLLFQKDSTPYFFNKIYTKF